MKKFPYFRCSAFFMLVFLFVGCKNQHIIHDVNYARPLESVLVPNPNGIVEDVRHGLQFSVYPLQFVEKGDSSYLQIESLRMVRIRSGNYLVTAPGFHNVYVLTPTNSGLIIGQTLLISESELISPFFNVRGDQIELIDQQNDLRSILVEDRSVVEVQS